MKTIGFADFYISEWHANNYPAWIKKICAEQKKEFELKYVWAEKYVSPVDGKNTDEWCAEYECEKCETLAELCEKCDYIVVLAPSNPEKHLEYASEVLKYKKNTYIDKTFAPDYETAKKIFDIAEENGTRFFSTSALRYADELKDLSDVTNVITFGGGRDFEEYIIHSIEMAEKLIAEKPLALRLEIQGAQYICNIMFENNKKATLIWAGSLAYAVCIQNVGGESIYKNIQSEFFINLISDMLRFFETGEVSFDTVQTLEVMKIRSGIIKAEKSEGEWIKL